MREKCRLCLGSIGYRKGCSIADETFSPILCSVFSFTILQNEPNLPTTACARCVTVVRDFHDYSASVQSNQETLMREYANRAENVAKDLIYENETGPSRIESHPITEYSEEIEEENDHAMDIISEEHLIEDVELMSNDGEDSSIDEGLESAVLKVDLQGEQNETLNAQSKCSTDKSKAKPILHENDRIIQEFFTMRCELCPARTEQHFDRFHALQLHYRKQHQCRGFLRCCGKQFFRRFLVMEHIASHRGMICCKLCNKTFKSKSYLLRHTAEQHMVAEKSKPYACEHCDRTFHTKSQRDMHRTVHDTTNCEVCGKSVRTAYLKKHIAQIHDAPRKWFMCDLCGKNFSGSLALDRHLKQHQGIEAIETMECVHCGKLLSGKYNMQKHVQRMHLEVGNVYRCDVCEHESPNSMALENHKKRVHSGEQHECDQCGRRFKRKIYLTEHIAALHTRIPLYTCEFCEARFNSKANYYSHRKTRHAEELKSLREEKRAKVLKSV